MPWLDTSRYQPTFILSGLWCHRWPFGLFLWIEQDITAHARSSILDDTLRCYTVKWVNIDASNGLSSVPLLTSTRTNTFSLRKIFIEIYFLLDKWYFEMSATESRPYINSVFLWWWNNRCGHVSHWGHWWRRLQPTSSIITDAKSFDSNRDDFARLICIFRLGFLYNYSS